MIAWAKMMGGIHFQRYVLAGAAVLAVAYDTLGVLYGYLAGALHQQNCHYGYCEEQYYFNDEHHQTALSGCITRHTGNELVEQCLRQARDNTYKDYEGYTVADTTVGDSFAQPHDEHGACGEHYCEIASGPEVEFKGTLCLHLEVDQIGRGLEQQNQYSQITGVLVQLLATAFTLALHLLERGQNHAAQLDNNRSCNVWHDTQGEDRGLRERATCEHIEELHQTAGVGELAQLVDGFGRDTGQHNVATQAVDKYQQQGYEDALAQLFDSPDVFKGLNKSHYNQILLTEPPAASIAACAACENAWASTVRARFTAPLARIFTSWLRLM